MICKEIVLKHIQGVVITCCYMAWNAGGKHSQSLHPGALMHLNLPDRLPGSEIFPNLKVCFSL